jgi:hypothetical protein
MAIAPPLAFTSYRSARSSSSHASTQTSDWTAKASLRSTAATSDKPMAAPGQRAGGRLNRGVTRVYAVASGRRKI